MTLIDIYSMLQSKQLNQEEAAHALDMTLKDFKFRLTRWGHRLPLLLATLDKLKANEISRSDAAETLGVSTRQVNTLQNTWNVERPVKSYLIERTASKIKWEVHKKFAIDYIADSDTVEAAAELAGISPRQMRRVVSQLLNKHFNMVFKDLKELSTTRRRRLAEEIETAEGLELAKQQALNDIANGRKSLNDEALERLLDRRKRRRANV